MVDHYADSRTSTHTECGKEVGKVSYYVIGNPPQGVTCKYCLKKLANRGIVAKSEWMFGNKDEDEIFDLITFEDLLEDHKIIFNMGQRKLLEYLRDVALITPEAYQSPKSVIIKMLKQMDGKQ
jgi:hypothetical protein